MFCTNCGKSLPANAQFCPGCGQVISSAGKINGGTMPPAGGNPVCNAPVPATHKNGTRRRTETFIALGILAVLLGIAAVAAYINWNARPTSDRLPDRMGNQKPDAITDDANVPPSAGVKSYYDMDFDEIYAEFLGTYVTDGYTLLIGYSPAGQAPAATLDSGANHYYLDTVSTNVERPDWVSLDLAASSQEVTVRFAANYDHPERYQAFITTSYGGTTKLTDIVKISNEADIAAFLPAAVFPYSDSQLLNSWEIENLSDSDLTYAINEIYARHGYIFKSDELRRHFEQFDWYHGTIAADDFSFDLLNSIEQQNLNLLANERNRRK